jgi:predicted RNA-binding Zn-ribbon protein involved in translation (DUF1610 family)
VVEHHRNRCGVSLCRKCGYDLAGLAGRTQRCPECGESIIVRDEVRPAARKLTCSILLVSIATLLSICSFVIYELTLPEQAATLLCLPILPSVWLLLYVAFRRVDVHVARRRSSAAEEATYVLIAVVALSWIISSMVG